MTINGYTIIKGRENGQTVFYAVAGDTALIFVDMIDLKTFCDKIPASDELLKTL